MRIVQKYGGSSVKDAERIRAVAARIAERWRQGDELIVVVSAMGKTTDQLIALAKDVAGGRRTAAHLEREMDMLLSTGEQVSIALLAMALGALGVPAKSLTGWQAGIVTEAVHEKARIETIHAQKLEALLAARTVAIVAGFQGVTEDGEITTLGRGGSDTTAVALAVATGADRCEIYTDVPGVYTTDPRLVPDACLLQTVTYDEMLELAHLGAGVLHPRSVELAKRHRMPLLVASSYVDEGGTLIVERAQSLENGRLVTGVALDKAVARVTLVGLPMRETTLAELFGALAKANVNVDIIIHTTRTDGTTDVAFSVHEDDVELAREVIGDLKERLGFAALESEQGLSKVSIVGSGMVTHPGVAAEMFRLLSEAGIAVKMVSTSEIKVSVVIPREAGAEAVRVLHSGFGLGDDRGHGALAARIAEQAG